MLMKKLSRLLPILALVLILLTGCNSGGTASSELESLMADGNYIIVDVRTKEEYAASHIRGSINIPYDEIDENIELDKAKKILVYCQSGNRSKKAFVSLTNIGYNVYDLGGIDDIDLPKE